MLPPNKVIYNPTHFNLQLDKNKYKKLALSATRARIAYKKPDIVYELWKDQKLEIFQNVKTPPTFHDDKINNAQAYSWIEDDVLHVAFRGTQEKQDIIADLDVRRSELVVDNEKNILIHSGFLKQFNSIKNLITPEIETNIDNINTIEFTGHSLGSALSTIAAAYYGNKYSNKKIICYTFGSPRVGNSEFIQWFDKNVHEHIRVANTQDPVSMIPITHRFTHVNHCLSMDDDCNVKYEKLDKPWFMRVITVPFYIDYKKPIKDHSCDIYIDKLCKLANAQKD